MQTVNRGRPAVSRTAARRSSSKRDAIASVAERWAAQALTGAFLASHRHRTIADTHALARLPAGVSDGGLADPLGLAMCSVDSTQTCHSTTWCHTTTSCPSTTNCPSVQTCVDDTAHADVAARLWPLGAG